MARRSYTLWDFVLGTVGALLLMLVMALAFIPALFQFCWEWYLEKKR